MLRDTTSRGLCVRVWPPHTSERRGGGGGCEQEGWQGGEGSASMPSSGHRDDPGPLHRFLAFLVINGPIAHPCFPQYTVQLCAPRVRHAQRGAPPLYRHAPNRVGEQ